MDDNNSDNGNGEGSSVMWVQVSPLRICALQCQEMSQLLWQPTSQIDTEYRSTPSVNIAGLPGGLALCQEH